MAASSFLIVGGQRLVVDQTFKGSTHSIYEDDEEDYDEELERRAQLDEEDRRMREELAEQYRSSHESHIAGLRQEDADYQERRQQASKRQRYDDDYDDYAIDGADDENSSLAKKSRNLAAATSSSTTIVDETILPMSEFGADAEWYVERESTVDKEKDYVHMMDPEQRDMESLLRPGESLIPDPCFACDFLKNPKANKFYENEWLKVVEYWNHSMTMQMRWSSLGRTLYRVFTETVEQVMFKQGRITERDTLWSPYGILYHFREQCKDDAQTSRLHVRKVDRAIDVVFTNELYLRHPSSTRQVVSKEAIDKLERLARVRAALGRSVSVTTGLSSSSTSSSSSTTTGKVDATRKLYTSLAKDLQSRPNHLTPFSRYN